MKNFAFLFLIVCFFSCDTPETPIMCDDAALFSREDASGSMFYMPCYDSWAIHMDETAPDDGRMNAASLDIPEEFKVDGMRVVFDACFYEFDLPLILADPMPLGLSYVIRDFTISEE